MSFLGMYGMEGLPSSTDVDQASKLFNFSTSAAASVITGRRGSGRALKVTGASNQSLNIPLAGFGSSDTTWIVGMGFKVTSYDHSNDGGVIVKFMDVDEAAMLTLHPSASALVVRRGDQNGTALGVASVSFINTIWYFIELKVTFHGSTGTVDLHVNEQDVLGLTSQNTTATGNTLPYEIRVGTDNVHGFAIDDLYICDGAGGSFDDFLNDNLIEAIRPDGNGNTNNYTGSDADSTDNYLHVDETDVDDDTSYNESATVGHKDLYTMGAMTSGPAAIEAIAVNSYCRKTDGGSREMQHICRSNTTESNSATISPSTDYAYYHSVYTVDPDTSSAWDEAGVNAVEGGTEVTA